MNSEIIAKLIIAFAIGMAISPFLTPIYVYLKKVMYHPFLNKKLLDKAIKEEHIVTAKKIKENGINNYTESGVLPTNEKIATYEYTYNNKKYKSRFISVNYMADEIKLYFISNPRKATYGGNLWTTAKNHWIRSYFIMVVIISIITTFILIFNGEMLINFIDNILVTGK